MDNQKLSYLDRNFIWGHNNFSVYRSLGLIYPLYKLFESTIDVRYLCSESPFKIPGSPHLFRNTYNFKEIIDYLSKFYNPEAIKASLLKAYSHDIAGKIASLRHVYVLYDIYNRNCKFNKGKSTSYKFMYSTDLALWHSMATFAFPLYSIQLCHSLFLFLINFKANRNIFLNTFGLFASFYVFFNLVKLGDITADFIMNNTFRKFVYDYKLQENNDFTKEYDKLKALDNTEF